MPVGVGVHTNGLRRPATPPFCLNANMGRFCVVLASRNGIFGQLLSTTKDGEHEDVIISNAVHDAIAA
jgi:hypothetical protein